MPGRERLYLYWDPAIDGAFRRRLERALGELRVDTANGDEVDPDPDNPGVVMALASAAGGWAMPARADIKVQAGPGDFPQSSSALRLTAEDIEDATPRWSRFLDKLRGKLGMQSLALPAEDLAVRLDDAGRRVDAAERNLATARLNESNAIRERRQIELELADLRAKADALTAENAQLRRIADSGAFALALVPGDIRAHVADARDHAWRAQAAAARASAAAAIHADAIAWSGGVSYSGEHRNGRPDGYGVMLFRGAAFYRGEFANGRRSGHGVGADEDGREWSGQWKDDEACGLGVLETRDGRRYEGEVRPDKHGAPEAGRGWSWRSPAEPQANAPHHPVNPKLPAP